MPHLKGSRFSREKKSTCVEAEARFQTAVLSCSPLGEIPEFTGDNAATKHKFGDRVNKSVKTGLNTENRERWESHVKELVVQGNFLALAAAEKQDLVWK